MQVRCDFVLWLKKALEKNGKALQSAVEFWRSDGGKMSLVAGRVLHPVFAMYEYVVVSDCNISMIKSSWISVGSATWRLHIVWVKDVGLSLSPDA